MTQEELETVAKVLGREPTKSVDLRGRQIYLRGKKELVGNSLSDLNILIPELERWCKERGCWWSMTCAPEFKRYDVHLYGDEEVDSVLSEAPDLATAICKALIATEGV